MQLHWHRRDLRIPDNRGLSSAARTGAAAPVFVFDPDVLAHASPPRVAYLLDALRALRDAYRARGSELLLARGDPSELLPELARQLDATSVGWNQDYSGLARERDAAVRRALAGAGIDRDAHHDKLCHEPGTITTNAGDHYSVYSYFWRKWQDREKDDPISVDSDALRAVDPDHDALCSDVPTLTKLGFDEPEAAVPPAGTAAARERLDEFLAGPIYRYADRRDLPAADDTSRLSAPLKWGTIGIREVYAGTADAMANAVEEDDRESVEEFQSQLAWREFYAHVLSANPETVSENFKAYEQPIEWRSDPAGLQAWKEGRTGYPIVDAGMRQLRAEAWMHNRVRMLVASFLTKDLLIDWRAGYDWFRRKLVDHDPANDVGGWQWAASTGTDAQPYFRIFNPMKQGAEYDPDAEYITTHVPELRDVPADVIHSWHERAPAEREHHAPEYPAPIVDHAEARERALATFERAREEE